MTVGWGFLGAGWIAQRAMAPAVHRAGLAHLQSAASREPSRTAALDPLTAHASYADVLDDPAVDVVYVCLANHQHAEWAIAALAAGKHVVCEKPLALDHAQAELMAAAAREADRLLVEAVWSRWHPRFRRLAALASEGDLGDLVSVDTAFTFRGDVTSGYRSRPECGGGALMDVGGYQVHAWLAVTGARADVAVQRVETARAASGIDETTRIEAVVGTTTRATGVASFALPERQALVVSGTAARARTGLGDAYTTWREPSTLLVGDHVEDFPAVDAYQLMVDAVSDRVRGGDAWLVPLEESVYVAAVLDSVRDQMSSR